MKKKLKTEKPVLLFAIYYASAVITVENIDGADDGYGPTYVWRVNQQEDPQETVGIRSGAMKLDPLVSCWFNSIEDAAYVLAPAIMENAETYVDWKQPESRCAKSFDFMRNKFLAEDGPDCVYIDTIPPLSPFEPDN